MSDLITNIKNLFKSKYEKEREKFNEILELEKELYQYEVEDTIASVHPYLSLYNEYLLKLQTITNSILNEYYTNMIFCQVNISMMIKTMIVGDFVRFGMERVLCEDKEPICCFKPERLFIVNKHCEYYSDKYIYLFNTFYKNIIKYYYLKISLCIEDPKLSIPEKLEYIFNTLLECYKTVLYQLQHINISCKDIQDFNFIKKFKKHICEVTESAHASCYNYVKKYVVLLITDIVHKYDIITDDIINAMNLLKPQTTLLILDYKLLSRNGNTINIEEHPNLLLIIERIEDIFKDIFIINYEGINFGPYEKQFEYKKLYNKEELKLLVKKWKDNKFQEIPDLEIIRNEAKEIIRKRNEIKKKINLIKDREF